MIELSSFFEKMKDSLSVFKIPKESVLHYLALAGILIIAFLIRAYPIIAYGYSLRAYDTFIQYMATTIIEKKGLLYFLTHVDYNTWYPWGRSWTALYIGIPFTAYILHKLLLFLGFNVELIVIASAMPPFFGTLAVLSVYGVATEIKSKRAGLFASFLAAISAGMIQRTIAGFFDNESVGIFLIIFSIYLFILASKRGSVLYAILDGLVLGFLGWTWGIYRYVFGLFALYVFVLLIARKLDNNVALTYIIVAGWGLSITAILPRNYGIVLSIEGMLVLGVLLLIIIREIAVYLSRTLAGGAKQAYTVMSIGGGIIIIAGILALYAMGQLAPLGAKFASVINPVLRTGLPTFSSVSENQPAAWGVIFLGVFASILFAPLGLYYSLEHRDIAQIFLLVMVLTGFYFSASISRYIALGAPLLAIGAGIGIDYLLDPFARVMRGEWIVHRIKPVRARLGEAKLPKGEAFAVYLLIALVLSLSVHNAVLSVTAARFGAGKYDIDSTELAVLDYLRTHASPTDIVLSWWDYGYRLRVYGNVTVLVDNGTGNSTQMGIVGAMFMLPEEKSITLIKKFNVKYVVVYGVDLFKAIWMIRIAQKYASMFNITEKDYFNADKGRYKEPFFNSVLWKLIAYKEDDRQVTGWIQQIGEEEITKNPDKYIPKKLIYFEPVLFAKKAGSLVKLYRVVYRTSQIPPKSPSANRTETTMLISRNQVTARYLYPSEKALIHVLYTHSLMTESHKSYIW